MTLLAPASSCLAHALSRSSTPAEASGPVVGAPVRAWSALSCRAGLFLGPPCHGRTGPACHPRLGWCRARLSTANSPRQTRRVCPSPQTGSASTEILLLPMPAVQFCFQGSMKHRIRGGLTGGEDGLHHAGTLQEDFSYAGSLPHTVGRSGSRRLHGECFRTCGQALCLPCDGILAYPPENHKSNDTAAKPQGSSRHRESEQGAVQSTGPCSLPAGLGFGKEECRSVPQAGSSSSGSSSADDVLCQAGLRSLLFSFLVPCSSSSSRYWTGPLPTFFSTGGIAPPLLCRQNNGLDSELAHPAVAEVERGMEDLAGLELEASHLRLDGVEGHALFNGDSELFDAFLAEDDSGS